LTKKMIACNKCTTLLVKPFSHSYPEHGQT
jgi:hypothetical protein